MPRSDDSLEQLRAALDDLAAADAADLLNEARIEARARVRATLTDALAHSMLERLHEQLPTSASAAEPPARAAQPPARAAEPPVRAAEPPARAAGARARPQRARRKRHTSEPAWYVYGVVSSDTELSGSLPGVEPAHSITLLREDALAAVASQVPLEEFNEERLREHLGDMAWVEATARAHETVLDLVREQTTVIPMRMCTVYRTDDGAREMLRREADALHEALDHLHGKAEWGVKVFADLGALDEADPPGDPDGAGSSPGAAYMQRKRTERARREQALERIEEATTLIHNRLSAVASDAMVVPPQRPEAHGHEGEMVLNGVYLVGDDAVEGFHDELRALAGELAPDAIELEPTGPWPAYNFVPGTIGAAW